jgi:hypothetical protein
MMAAKHEDPGLATDTEAEDGSGLGTMKRVLEEAPMEHEVATSRDQVGRAVGVVGLAGIALIHLLDAVGKYGETRYIFALYIVLMVSTLGAAAVLLRTDSRLAWAYAVVASGATLIAFVVSRTTGLPGAPQDVGNWSDSLGLASLFVEGCTLLLGIYKLSTILPLPASNSSSCVGGDSTRG